MIDYNIVLPSKPRVELEEGFTGVYEIDGLYPGYGHTLGNSLRRIILSSLPGAAVISVKIKGVSHEFSTIPGVKEDVIAILLNLKKIRVRMNTDEPQTLELKTKKVGVLTAGDMKIPGQVEILNPEQPILTITDKSADVDMEIRTEKGLGYVSKEILQKERVDIGIVAMDAIFTPIRRVNYEVENMRVGDRTDFNKLRIFIETDGTLSPREALESSILIMINQLKSIVGFKEESLIHDEVIDEVEEEHKTDSKELDKEFLKTRIEDLGLSARTLNALSAANIRTVGGLARKKEEDILDIDRLGSKGMQEIKRALSNYGITLK
jgi:DNA-directed RNA polymerase subunit alpha